MLENLERFLKEKDVEYTENFEISRLSYIGVGGRAKIVAYPDDTDKLTSLLLRLNELGISYRVVGRMTNLLASELGYDGVLISTVRLNGISPMGELLFSECGANTSELVRIMAARGYGGAEGLCSVPGTVGGAVAGNAGAFGSEISDIFVSGRFFHSEKGIVNLVLKDMEFGYRSSRLSDGSLVFLDGIFRFERADSESIKNKISLFKEQRSNTQPTDKRSLGCIFKRHNGVSAAYYIDRCGLKGYTVGGASVSQKHAGFIINSGGATSDDIMRLVSIIKEKVYLEFGVVLSEEIKYL